MYKFRTMCPDAEQKLKDLMDHNEKDGPVFKMKNDPRITRVGKFLRKTSIDELPQLFNVLKGEMSIVGPRPALPHEVAQYTAYEWQRLYVTPGLSCYWQIAPHRDQLSFEEWMAGWSWRITSYRKKSPLCSCTAGILLFVGNDKFLPSSPMRCHLPLRGRLWRCNKTETAPPPGELANPQGVD